MPGELRWQTSCVTCPSPPLPPLAPPSQPPSDTSYQCYAGAESAYDGVPGELQWQTSGAPHHLHMAPAAKQPLPDGGKKKEGLVRRRKDPFVGSPSPEQATPAGLQPLASPSPFPLLNAKLLLQSTCKYSQSRPCRTIGFWSESMLRVFFP